MDGGLQPFDRLCGIDRHLAGGEVHPDLRGVIVFANGAYDGRDAMLAAHAFYLKFNCHRDFL
jgi:hypothetical protein